MEASSCPGCNCILLAYLLVLTRNPVGVRACVWLAVLLRSIEFLFLSFGEEDAEQGLCARSSWLWALRVPACP